MTAADSTAHTAFTAHLAPTVYRDVADTRSDRERIDAAFRKLRKLGYAAYMSVEDAPVQRYDAKAVYWYKHADRGAFGERDLRSHDLVGTLDVRWQGDIAEIVRVLTAEGIRAIPPANNVMPIRMLPQPTAQHRFVPIPDALVNGDYKQPCCVCGAMYSAHKPLKRR